MLYKGVNMERVELYTTDDIAAIVRVTVVTVERWLCAGKLKGRKVGKRWLVNPYDLRDFMSGKTKRRGGKP